MASFSAYPQNVTFQTVNVAKGGGSENLLINPRGKINQLNEADGVLAAGQYFCDGWKAGALGAEVYIDDDGFRLISGSIVQLVPNGIEFGRNLRSNMDVISGTPVMSINGGTSNEPNGAGAYIQFEISGDNSKFTRLILAESVELPIFQQGQDELTPCKRFLQVYGGAGNSYPMILNMHTSNTQYGSMPLVPEMADRPAVSIGGQTQTVGIVHISRKTLTAVATNSTGMALLSFTLDARP